jgi:diguanylate cyclase (GGDEF)-like protein
MPKNEREKIRHLLVIKDLQGQRTIPLQEATYSLGRDSRNAIALRSRSVSRQHAILLRVTVPETDEYGFRIIDGSFKGKRSTNGLFVNGTKCFAHDLQHGDVIEFGSTQAQAKYYAISNLSEQTFSKYCEIQDISKHLTPDQAHPVNPFETLVGLSDTMLETASEVALARLASFPELIPNPIIEIDSEGRITYLNPSAASKFPNLRTDGQEHPILSGLTNIVQTGEKNSFIREVEVNGEVFEQSIHYLPESDLIRTFIVRDITEQKLVQAELHQRDRLLQAVAEATNYLLVELNYEKAIEKALARLGEAAKVDRVYLFENYSQPMTDEMVVSLRFEWTSYNCDPSQHHWQNLPYDTPNWYVALSNGHPIRGITPEFPTVEQELLLKSGIQSLLLVPLRLDDTFWGCLGWADCSSQRRWSTHEESTLLTMAASISGARLRQQVEEKIRYQALHDMLTGLPNRQLFDEILSTAVPNASRSGESLAVMFLDLDRFKTINDTLGHTLGDQLLKSVAQRLRDSLRAGDTVARWGGDEFTVLLPRIIQVEEVIRVAQRILQAIENPYYFDTHELYVSASIGIALFNDDSPNSETLIQHADAALYQAKELGRNNYQFYTASIGSKAPNTLTLEKSLRHALERKELVVYYQPRVNIVTGQITGMEALLRWQHPDMGLVAPNVFIPLAEENGLIIPIGEWVLRTACHQNKLWQNAGLPAVTMAVNLSPKQFRQPKLVETVEMILRQTGLEPHFLELEITETTAVEDIEFTRRVLQQLEKMGVHLSIDDFGTGHSSLSRLQLLPLHNLKIDRSFIKNLTLDAKASHIITAIVTLGRSLGLQITAEGVEKPEEVEFLKSIHCENVQGFFYYRPLSAQKVTEVLQRGGVMI